MAKKNVSVISSVNLPIVIPQHKDLYTIPEAALRMSTTVFAVRQLCRSGELKYVPIGHAWLISPGAIQDFIHRKEQELQRAA
jgi:hypothetical protein